MASAMVSPPVVAGPSGNGKGSGSAAPLPEGATSGMSDKARQAAEDEAKEELCPICYEILPAMGRGVIPCGHVFCFSCIHLWTQTSANCPTCRIAFKKITKTLTGDDIAEEEARIERSKNKNKIRMKNKKDLSKSQITRMKKRNSRVKTPLPGVKAKDIRIRDKTKKKKTASISRIYVSLYTRQREEQQRTQREHAQARALELAAEAQRTAAEHTEAARVAREQANQAVEEQERRAREAEEDAPAATAPNPVLEAALRRQQPQQEGEAEVHDVGGESEDEEMGGTGARATAMDLLALLPQERLPVVQGGC